MIYETTAFFSAPQQSSHLHSLNNYGDKYIKRSGRLTANLRQWQIRFHTCVLSQPQLKYKHYTHDPCQESVLSCTQHTCFSSLLFNKPYSYLAVACSVTKGVLRIIIRRLRFADKAATAMPGWGGTWCSHWVGMWWARTWRQRHHTS